MKPSFITGCKSYKIDAITKHEESDLEKLKPSCKSLLKNQIQQKYCVHQTKAIQKKLLKTSHALVLKNRPISDFLQNRDAYMHMSCWNK